MVLICVDIRKILLYGADNKGDGDDNKSSWIVKLIIKQQQRGA